MQDTLTTPDWLVDFSHRYDANRRSRDEVADLKARSSTFDITNPFHVQSADEKRMIRERVEVGYVLPFAREIGGRVRQPFCEIGLRSTHNPILKLFVTRIPRKGKARASDNKADLYVPYFSKLLTLDCAYIEGTRELLSFIRLDCDAVFSSSEACLKALQSKVVSAAIPHLPHIIVGDEMASKADLAQTLAALGVLICGLPSSPKIVAAQALCACRLQHTSASFDYRQLARAVDHSDESGPVGRGRWIETNEHVEPLHKRL